MKNVGHHKILDDITCCSKAENAAFAERVTLLSFRDSEILCGGMT